MSRSSRKTDSRHRSSSTSTRKDSAQHRASRSDDIEDKTRSKEMSKAMSKTSSRSRSRSNNKLKRLLSSPPEKKKAPRSARKSVKQTFLFNSRSPADGKRRSKSRSGMRDSSSRSKLCSRSSILANAGGGDGKRTHHAVDVARVNSRHKRDNDMKTVSHKLDHGKRKSEKRRKLDRIIDISINSDGDSNSDGDGDSDTSVSCAEGDTRQTVRTHRQSKVTLKKSPIRTSIRTSKKSANADERNKMKQIQRSAYASNKQHQKQQQHPQPKKKKKKKKAKQKTIVLRVSLCSSSDESSTESSANVCVPPSSPSSDSSAQLSEQLSARNPERSDSESKTEMPSGHSSSSSDSEDYPFSLSQLHSNSFDGSDNDNEEEEESPAPSSTSTKLHSHLSEKKKKRFSLSRRHGRDHGKFAKSSSPPSSESEDTVMGRRLARQQRRQLHAQLQQQQQRQKHKANAKEHADACDIADEDLEIPYRMKWSDMDDDDEDDIHGGRGRGHGGGCGHRRGKKHARRKRKGAHKSKHQHKRKSEHSDGETKQKKTQSIKKAASPASNLSTPNNRHSKHSNSEKEDRQAPTTRNRSTNRSHNDNRYPNESESDSQASSTNNTSNTTSSSTDSSSEDGTGWSPSQIVQVGPTGSNRLRHKQYGREPLRPGDIVEYTHPLFVLGSAQGHRIAMVMSVKDRDDSKPTNARKSNVGRQQNDAPRSPSRFPPKKQILDDQRSPAGAPSGTDTDSVQESPSLCRYPLALNNGDTIPRDTSIRRIYEYDAKLRDWLHHLGGMYKPLGWYSLRSGSLLLDSTAHTSAGIDQKVKQLRAIKDKVMGEAWSKLNAGEFDHPCGHENVAVTAGGDGGVNEKKCDHGVDGDAGRAPKSDVADANKAAVRDTIEQRDETTNEHENPNGKGKGKEANDDGGDDGDDGDVIMIDGDDGSDGSDDGSDGDQRSILQAAEATTTTKTDAHSEHSHPLDDSSSSSSSSEDESLPLPMSPNRKKEKQASAFGANTSSALPQTAKSTKTRKEKYHESLLLDLDSDTDADAEDMKNRRVTHKQKARSRDEGKPQKSGVPSIPLPELPSTINATASATASATTSAPAPTSKPEPPFVPRQVFPRNTIQEMRPLFPSGPADTETAQRLLAMAEGRDYDAEQQAKQLTEVKGAAAASAAEDKGTTDSIEDSADSLVPGVGGIHNTVAAAAAAATSSKVRSVSTPPTNTKPHKIPQTPRSTSPRSGRRKARRLSYTPLQFVPVSRKRSPTSSPITPKSRNPRSPSTSRRSHQSPLSLSPGQAAHAHDGLLTCKQRLFPPSRPAVSKQIKAASLKPKTTVGRRLDEDLMASCMGEEEVQQAAKGEKVVGVNNSSTSNTKITDKHKDTKGADATGIEDPSRLQMTNRGTNSRINTDMPSSDEEDEDDLLDTKGLATSASYRRKTDEGPSIATGNKSNDGSKVNPEQSQKNRVASVTCASKTTASTKPTPVTSQDTISVSSDSSDSDDSGADDDSDDSAKERGAEAAEIEVIEIQDSPDKLPHTAIESQEMQKDLNQSATAAAATTAATTASVQSPTTSKMFQRTRSTKRRRTKRKVHGSDWLATNIPTSGHKSRLNTNAKSSSSSNNNNNSGTPSQSSIFPRFQVRKRPLASIAKRSRSKRHGDGKAGDGDDGKMAAEQENRDGNIMHDMSKTAHPSKCQRTARGKPIRPVMLPDEQTNKQQNGQTTQT